MSNEPGMFRSWGELLRFIGGMVLLFVLLFVLILGVLQWLIK